ncbi:putative F-box protein PP2-B12 [Apium graveolens]|uniref:putative F-box protein PP2-B12 n=1 Tax=Apium graveolens TaxID=4045 RepID=UPI003D78D805
MEHLTENCLSLILSFTSPKDTCRAAGDSDELWNKFLPPDINQILRRSISTLTYTTKKQLYFSLCDSAILLDDGNVSFWLDKGSGKKCLMVAARQLAIVPWWWQWLYDSNSRFSEEVAVLDKGRCVDIRGKMKIGMLSPHTTYETYLVFKIYEDACGLDSAKTSIRFVNEREEVPDDEASIVYPDPRTSAHNIEQRNGEFSRWRKDELMEIKIAEFETGARDDDDEVETRFMSTDTNVLKAGLIVQGFEFRPKQPMAVV